jgi:hypothetical protein
MSSTDELRLDTPAGRTTESISPEPAAVGSAPEATQSLVGRLSPPRP